jgi:hypothetical protein
MTSDQMPPARLQVQQRCVFRIALVGSILVIAIAYPILISLKLADILHLDWLRVLCGPAAFCAQLMVIVWLGNWVDLHRARRRPTRRGS